MGRRDAKDARAIGGEAFPPIPLQEMLVRQGFTAGTMAAPEALGGGIVNVVSKLFGL